VIKLELISDTLEKALVPGVVFVGTLPAGIASQCVHVAVVLAVHYSIFVTILIRELINVVRDCVSSTGHVGSTRLECSFPRGNVSIQHGATGIQPVILGYMVRSAEEPSSRRETTAGGGVTAS